MICMLFIKYSSDSGMMPSHVLQDTEIFCFCLYLVMTCLICTHGSIFWIKKDSHKIPFLVFGSIKRTQREQNSEKKKE